MLMNSHQHMELVEIETLVRITGSFDKPSYDLIEEEAEQAARQVMVRNGVDHSDFSYVCTLVAVTQVARRSHHRRQDAGDSGAQREDGVVSWKRSVSRRPRKEAQTMGG